jgi:hypothetical protein
MRMEAIMTKTDVVLKRTTAPDCSARWLNPLVRPKPRIRCSFSALLLVVALLAEQSFLSLHPAIAEEADANLTVAAVPEIRGPLHGRDVRDSTAPKLPRVESLLENGFDFTNPESIPGFGPLTAAEVHRALEHGFPGAVKR